MISKEKFDLFQPFKIKSVALLFGSLVRNASYTTNEVNTRPSDHRTNDPLRCSDAVWGNPKVSEASKKELKRLIAFGAFFAIHQNLPYFSYRRTLSLQIQLNQKLFLIVFLWKSWQSWHFDATLSNVDGQRTWMIDQICLAILTKA